MIKRESKEATKKQRRRPANNFRGCGHMEHSLCPNKIMLLFFVAIQQSMPNTPLSIRRSFPIFFAVLSLVAHSCLAQSDTVQRGRGIIEGRVIYNRSYIPNASIRAYEGNRLMARAKADTDGIFRLLHLPAGNYKVVAITGYNDVLMSKTLAVRNTDLLTTECDEFFLAQAKPKTSKKKYADTLLKQVVDSVVVYKKRREMAVFGSGRLLKVYHICLGFTPVGAKHFQGDGKTPEGNYTLSCKNPYSQYHKSLCISYPNKDDREFAHKAGKQPGGDVMIHGLPNGEGSRKDEYVADDWTWGCIALNDEEIDDLYAHVHERTPIMLLP